ncbi:MAG TPA: hypothetical protein VFU13_01435 [Steroidobacteraceae bacterium]|nr:hypothetical protein [Steroidobacteraceae bacterium]
MKKTILVVLFLLAAACDRPPGKPAAQSTGITERTFQRRAVDGDQVFTVRVSATSQVSPQMLDVLERDLKIRPIGQETKSELAFWTDAPMAINPERAEVQVELMAADSRVDARRWLWTWPDLFQMSRPGVLEERPGSGGQTMSPENKKPADDDVGVVVQALHGGPHAVRGRLLCSGAPAQFLRVVAGGIGGFSAANGTFELTGEFPGVPGTVFVAYDAQIPLGSGATPTAPLQIMDDFHFARNDRIDSTPTTTGEVSAFGDLNLPGTDCLLWQRGIRALRHLFSVNNAPPPAGGLTIKRWSAVFMSAGAAPHTFYDYIVAPTDLASNDTSGDTLFHEFGHSIRHVADGAHTHWDYDNFRFIYARGHDGSQTNNKGFAFNEGWANYWSAAVRGTAVSVHTAAPTDASFIDFNEDRVGQRLRTLSGAVSHGFMVDVLRNNPGVIHTLQQFEERYCAAASSTNPFCSGGRPTRTVPACPTGYNDDGLTCRLINIVGKPTFDRGVGTIPDSCGPDRRYEAGLCYTPCPAGFSGVGPVCWQICPSGYHDDGATCRRDAWIFGSNNNACPWYDKCGVTFARGCSVCPSGFHNDGCTCRRDVSIIGKTTRDRGVGTIPSGCRPGRQYEAGLCYTACPAGTNGIGPVCWGRCPAGFADHGATCYRDPNIFSDDPVIPP